jgi:hypothetical protein
VVELAVPFYGMANGIFLFDVVRSAGDILMSTMLGPSRESLIEGDKTESTAGLAVRLAFSLLESRRLLAKEALPVVVGYSSNGLFAKAANFPFDPWRVAFDAPMFDRSCLIDVANAVDHQDSRAVNVFSDGSPLVLVDSAAAWNVPIPNYGSVPYVPRTSFHNLCVVAATCAMDARYDVLCSDVMGGRKEFFRLFEAFGRQRFDI